MRRIETDYLVVGAGASGMAFVDALLANDDGADVVVVDRRHAPGGHWLDAYPFVRLHQPSATYGVNSRVLGLDRIDEVGPNAGFYERATAPEICGYFRRVLDEHFLASGRVRFLGAHDYRGADADGHHTVSLVSGRETTVRVRRKLVDATYTESSIPSRHTPAFVVDDGARVIPPNGLVDLQDAPRRFTVLGAGKTATDTCGWLLDAGVAPDDIRWIRPRDGWQFDRAFTQPLALVASYMELQAHWVEAAATVDDATAFFHRLEDAGVFVRVDRDVEPTMFRGATISRPEVEALRTIEQVVRLGKVRRIGSDGATLDGGSVPSVAGEVYVDCTASGVRSTITRPVFEPGRITLQYVTIGFVCWSAAIQGFVEARRDDDAEKNRLCPPLSFSGRTDDVFEQAYIGMTGLARRGAEADVAAWDGTSRLNPTRGVAERIDDARVGAALATLGASFGAAMHNLERLVGAPAA